MSHREVRNGDVAVTISETEPANPHTDAQVEITFAPRKAPSEPVGGSDVGDHLLASMQLRLRRDPAEFAAGLLTREHAESAVLAVTEFFDRHLGPLTRSGSAVPPASARK